MANENTVLKFIKNLKSKWTLVLLCIIGVALLMVSKSVTSKQQSVKNDGNTYENAEQYRQKLEEELEVFCSRIDGVGNVSVMIVLDNCEENIYAKNGSGDKQSYVTYSGNGILLTTRTPTVRGVAVACDGGDNIAIKEEVTNALSSLLGIGTNRISVSKKVTLSQ